MNYFKNNAFSVLAASATAGDTALTLAAGTGSRFPDANFFVTLIGYDDSGNENSWEIVRCTGRSSDTLTVVRAQEGTSAAAWPGATRIENRVTAASMEALQDKTTFSDTAPTSPVNGQVWADGTTGIEYTWLEDGTSGQWVELGPGGAKSAWADITGKPAVIAAGADAAAARAAIGAGTGSGDVTLAGAQTLTNKTLTTPLITGTREVLVAMPANDIDLATGNLFTKTISAATTLTVSNVPTTGTAASFILELTNAGSAAITWFSGVKWAGGTAPTLTASGVDVLGFYSHDGGTTWRGMLLAKDSK